MKERMRAGLSPRVWVPGLAALIFVVLLCQTLRKASRAIGYDLNAYLMAARALFDGNNPYALDAIFPYIYPLFLAFAMAPLAAMPDLVATVAWFVLSIWCLGTSCVVLFRCATAEIRASSGWHLAVPALMLFAVSFSPIHSNLLNGQVNTLVLVCCVMFFACFAQNRATAGAAWLGAAIALKILPAVLIAFLVVRKRFGFALAASGFAILFCLLPMVIVGDNLFGYYVTYLDRFLLKGAASLGSGKATAFNLQSVFAHFIPSAGDSPAIRTLSVAISLSLVALVELVTLRLPDVRSHVWSFCAYLITSLFLSPMGETHHLVFAVPAILLVGMKATFDHQWRTTGLTTLLTCFVVSFIALPRIFDAKPLGFIGLVLLTILLFLAALSAARSDLTTRLAGSRAEGAAPASASPPSHPSQSLQSPDETPETTFEAVI